MTSRLGIAITLVAAGLLVTSSVGVSTVALERSIEIDVVDDESAMVGFNTTESNDNGSPVESLEVENRAGSKLTVDVTSESETEIEPSAELGPGDEATISVSNDCEDEVTLDVALTGDGIRIERTVSLDCGD